MTQIERPLTDQQQKVLDFVQAFSDEHGFPPTLREIGQAVGLVNVNAVRGHVEALLRKGYIVKDPDKARSIRLTGPSSTFSAFKRKLHDIVGTDQGVLHRVVYGLGWAAWQGRPILAGPVAAHVQAAIDHEASEHGWTVRRMHIEPDRLMLVMEVWPNHSAQQTVKRLEFAWKASRLLHGREFPRHPLWAKGYVVTTDLTILEALVDRLVELQKQGKVP